MRKETIFEMTSPYRDNFRITGYHFGNGEKTLAIVGAMRGDEVQQQYICSQLVNRLQLIEQRGGINDGNSILVIPSCNPFSMNVSRRFWAMDSTDINRMFPGYDQERPPSVLPLPSSRHLMATNTAYSWLPTTCLVISFPMCGCSRRATRTWRPPVSSACVTSPSISHAHLIPRCLTTTGNCGTLRHSQFMLVTQTA